MADHDCGLCEVHTGDADGMDWRDYNATLGSFDMEAEPDRPFAPGGESWNGFHEGAPHPRPARARARRPDGGGGVPRRRDHGVAAAAARHRPPRHQRQLRPDNTGLTEWEHDGDRWTLRSYNETVHLVGLEARA
ncbi:MAG: hypothetical protein R2711_11255 [Acidimicrobiales bacterium]